MVYGAEIPGGEVERTHLATNGSVLERVQLLGAQCSPGWIQCRMGPRMGMEGVGASMSSATAR